MLCVWVHMVTIREGFGWLAADTIPNSLYRVPFFYIFLACALCLKKNLNAIVPFILSFLFCFLFCLRALVGAL